MSSTPTDAIEITAQIMKRPPIESTKTGFDEFPFGWRPVLQPVMKTMIARQMQGRQKHDNIRYLFHTPLGFPQVCLGHVP